AGLFRRYDGRWLVTEAGDDDRIVIQAAVRVGACVEDAEVRLLQSRGHASEGSLCRRPLGRALVAQHVEVDGDHAVRALKHRKDVAGMNRPAERHRPKGEMIEQRPFRRYLNVVRDPRRIWDYLRADFDRDTAEVGDLEPVIDVALRGEGVVQRLQGIGGKSRAFLGRDRQVHRLLDSVPDPGGARLRNQPGGGQQRLEVAERDYTTEGLDGGGRRLPRRVQGLGIGRAFGRQWIANF